jgi:hypothetical protein
MDARFAVPMARLHVGWYLFGWQRCRRFLRGFGTGLVVEKVGNDRRRKIGQQNQGFTLDYVPNLACFRPQNSGPFATGSAKHEQIWRTSIELERPLAYRLAINRGKVCDDAGELMAGCRVFG